jgi:ATP-dependent helicase HrpB
MVDFSHLPIYEVLPELEKTFLGGSSAVLMAPPGAGKTTAVPLALLDSVWMEEKRMILLSPRRLATRAAAHRMAVMLGEKTGETIGYRMRMERMIGRKTRVEVVTEGVFIRMIQNDPSLESVGMVIFDEFHERSLNADLALSFCMEVQSTLRPDLRMLVMSATLDTEPVAALLGQAPVITCHGRAHEVTTHYLEKESRTNIQELVLATVLQGLSMEIGSMLVFLPGEGEIRSLQGVLEEKITDRRVMITPLYGNLPRVEQERAIMPAATGFRKVVLATSIAETSLTIQGIRLVVDSGLMRVPFFDARTAMTGLNIIQVSRASARQRRGRAGRIESGVCFRIWTKGSHHRLVANNTPEILNSDLTSLVLELALWGISQPGQLEWIDGPPSGAFRQARELLVMLGGIDADGRITRHGKKMVALGLHPRLAHMLIGSERMGYGQSACELAAILVERDIIKKARGISDADLRTRIQAMESFRTGGNFKHFLQAVDRAACRRVEKYSRLLFQKLRPVSGEKRKDVTGKLLALAYPDRIGKRRPGGGGRFLFANGRGAFFPEIEPLSTEDYIVAAHLDAGIRESRIYLAAPFSLEALESLFPERITSINVVKWDNRSKRVLSRRQRTFGALVLRDDPLHNPSGNEVTREMITGIRMNGVQSLPWNRESRMLQARIMLLHDSSMGSHWPDVSDDSLLASLEEKFVSYLYGVTSFDQLKRVNLKKLILSALDWRGRRDLDRLAPERVTVPSGSSIKLDYLTGDVPVLPVRIQELFGINETPVIAGGKVALVLHLLSPAHRPVQMTRDLQSFWVNTYPDVRKDLKSRYPKHFWPSDPLSAVPTSRVKSGAGSAHGD